MYLYYNQLASAFVEAVFGISYSRLRTTGYLIDQLHHFFPTQRLLDPVSRDIPLSVDSRKTRSHRNRPRAGGPAPSDSQSNAFCISGTVQ